MIARNQMAEIKYYVTIIGPAASKYKSVLRRRLIKRLSDLSSALPAIVGVINASAVLRRNIKIPIVAVYFGGGSVEAGDIAAVRSLQTTSSVIIPVVSDLQKFNSEVPAELAGINGCELTSNQALDTVANLVLENLGLLRKTRRLFISYKRTEAAHEALQLRHELDAHGYDVFLDTHSVPKGDDFQEVLWQRLADCDIVVLLDTPDFMESRWTKAELAQAGAMTIGIIQVIWPGHKPAPYTDLCERVYLDKTDFKDTGQLGLTTKVLDQIIGAVEQLRARSLAARHNNLVREFCDAAASVGVSAIVQPERFITASLPSGRTIIAIPAVGALDAPRYHEATHRTLGHDASAPETFLIYDHRGLRPSWMAYLDWLDEFLPVKALKITNTALRLKLS